MASPVILVEASPRRAADGVSETVRLAGGGNQFPYFYGGVHWRAGVAKLPTFVTELTFDGGEFGAGGVPQAAEIQWGAATSADLADLANYMWVDAPITVRIGAENAAGDLPGVVLTGKVLSALPDGSMLKISLSDPAADLKKPLLKASANAFGGTGGLDGPVDWQGKIRKRLWGRLWNVQGECIDAVNSIYCWSDPARPLLSFDALRDKGAAAAQIDQLAWQGSAAATFAALQTAAAPQGGGIACPSIACVKWWTTPAGDLTADLRGEVAGGYVETTAEIVARIVGAGPATPFAAGTVAAAAALRPAPVGWIALDETTTVAAMIEDLLGSSSLLWLLNAAGEIELHPWAWGAPVAAASSLSVKRNSAFAPVGTRKLGFRRNELKMARGDLAGIVLVDNVEFPDGQALADAVANAGTTATWDGVTGAGKPEDNATVGAPSGTPVGSTTADQVATAVTTKVPSLEAAQAALDADVQAAQTQIATVQGQAANAAAAAASAHTDATNALAQVSAEIIRAQGAEGTLQASITSLTDNYNGLTSTVASNYLALSNANGALSGRIDTLAVGGGNLLPTTDFPGASLAGWDYGNQGLSNPWQAGVNQPSADWHPDGANVLTLYQNGRTGNADAYLWAHASKIIPVVAGQYYQAWTLAAAHRCRVAAWLIFVDSSGNWLSASGNTFDVGSGGTNPAAWTRIGSAYAFPAPAGAVGAFWEMRKLDTLDGYTDSWAWFWEPYLGQAKAGQTDWNPYSPGSAKAAVENETASRINATSALSTQIATMGVSIASNTAAINNEATTRADAVSTLSSQVTSLQTSYGSLSSTVNANYTALTNADASMASSISSLQANYGSLSAGVSSNALAIATLQTQAATFEQRLSAGSPNLLKNGSGEMGKSYWGDRSGTWGTVSDAWGSRFICATTGTGLWYFDSDPIQAGGGLQYTCTADAQIYTSSGTDGWARVELLWYSNVNGNDGFLRQDWGPTLTGCPSFTNSVANRAALKNTVTAPDGAVCCRVRLVAGGTNVTQASLRQCKFEAGSAATAYTQEATVLVQQAAIADARGKLQSYLGLSASVGSAAASVKLFASSDGGQTYTSSVALEGQEIVLTNAVGTSKKVALQLAGGNATFGGDIIIGGRILFANGLAMKLAVAPYLMAVSDGQSISYPNAGYLPAASFATTGLAPLSSGETYSLYLESQTAGGATVRLRIHTPGTPSNYNLTGDAAGGSGDPTRVINKGSRQDAANGQYTIQGTFSATAQAYYDSPGQFYADFVVTITIYAKVGGVWQQIGDYDGSATLPYSTSGTKTYTGSWSATVTAPTGVTDFGAQAATAITSLAWTAPGSASSDRTATPSGQTTQLTLTY